MKETATKTREVTSSGGQDEKAFTILANGKAFKTLIDGLYANKVRAVVRELFTNAFDSHVEKGTPERPFLCGVPSTMDPTFRVRDYGVSLTDDGVLNLYTTVFGTSKDQTNDQVGKLGLGSKSPFAYIDSFAVTSYLNGEKNVYSAFIGSDGVPKIKRMATLSTDEEDGLEIAFPVKLNDVNSFQSEIRTVCLGFDTLPTTEGVSDFEVTNEPGDVVMEGNGWKAFHSSYYEGERTLARGAYAKQGCVLYPIDPASLNNRFDDLLRASFIIDFPIGDVDIAASREALSYDDVTIKNIEARLGQIQEEVTAAASIVIPNTVATLMEATFDASIKYNEYQDNDFLRYKTSREFTWKGAKHGLEISIGGVNSHTKKDLYKTVRLQSLSHADMLSSRIISNGSRYTTFSPRKRTIFYIDDCTTRDASSRMRYDFSERGLNKLRSDEYRGIWIKYNDYKEVKHILKMLDYYPEVVRVNTLPKTPRATAKGTVRSTPKVKCQQLVVDQYGRGTWWSDNPKAFNVTEEPVGFYAFGYRDRVKVGEEGTYGPISEYSFRDILNHAAEQKWIDLSKQPVVILRPPYSKSVLKAAGWVNVLEFLDEKTPKPDTSIETKKEKSNTITSNYSLGSFLESLVSNHRVTPMVDKDSPLMEYINIVRDYRTLRLSVGEEYQQQVEAYKTIKRAVGKSSDIFLDEEREDFTDLDKAVTALAVTYPLLPIVNNSYSRRDNETLTAAVEYVKAIDMMKKGTKS
jgi:hypothetical protein